MSLSADRVAMSDHSKNWARYDTAHTESHKGDRAIAVPGGQLVDSDHVGRRGAKQRAAERRRNLDADLDERRGFEGVGTDPPRALRHSASHGNFGRTQAAARDVRRVIYPTSFSWKLLDD